MSYGWLTESSLLPRPGKEIKVPSSSLNSLQTVIYGEEEASKRRRDATNSTTTRPTKRLKPRMQRLLDECNDGVLARNKKDEEFFVANEKSFSNSRKKLEQKAKAYDLLIAKKHCGGEADSSKFLVDFEVKSWQKSNETHDEAEDDKQIGAKEEDIVIEFGRKQQLWEDGTLQTSKRLMAERREYLQQLTADTDKRNIEVGSARRQRREELQQRLLQLRQEKRQKALQRLELVEHACSTDAT